MAAIIRGGAQGLWPMTSQTSNISAIKKTSPAIRPAQIAAFQSVRARPLGRPMVMSAGQPQIAVVKHDFGQRQLPRQREGSLRQRCVQADR